MAAVGHSQQKTMWYRGYFDGEVTIKSGANAGMYYRPSRPTAYPLNETQYSDYLPCDTCGRHHRSGAYIPDLKAICNGNGSHLDPDLVYVPTPYKLPGQYWYKKQNHYNFRPMNNLGWPYWKYDQRTEATGAIPMGRGNGSSATYFRTR